MTIKELAARLEVLERSVAQLQKQLTPTDQNGTPWWVTQAGVFADFPDFEEVVRLGREYRQSFHADYPKKKRSRKNRKTKSSKNADS